jgi:hypothetical protein
MDPGLFFMGAGIGKISAVFNSLEHRANEGHGLKEG